MSLIARWKLDGNLLDSSGNGYHLSSTSLGYISGIYAEAPAFNTHDRAALDNPDFSNTQLDVQKSVAFWAYADGNASSKTAISFGNTDSQGASHLFLVYPYDNTGVLGVRVYVGSTGNVFTETGQDRSGRWNHFVITSKSGSHKLYVNGQFIKETTTTHIDLANFNQISIGSWYNSQKFNGNIQDMRLYDHILTPKEVDEIYHTPVWHYDFNNAKVDGEIISDLSSWDNHATLDSFAPTHTTVSHAIGSGAYSFNNANNEMIDTGWVPNYPSYNSFTFCCWIQTTQSSLGHILHAYEASGFEGFGVAMNIIGTSGNINVFTNTDNWHEAPTKKNVADGQLHHIAVIKNQTTTEVFVDGVSLGGEFAHTYPNLSVETAKIGHNQTSVNYNFLGIIDDPRFYPFALSAEKILELYQTKAEIAKTTGDLYLRGQVNQEILSLELDSGLWSYYKMEGNLIDATGNARNMTTDGSLFSSSYGKNGQGWFRTSTSSAQTGRYNNLTAIRDLWTNDWTMALWYNPQNLGGSYRDICGFNLDNNTPDNRHMTQCLCYTVNPLNIYARFNDENFVPSLLYATLPSYNTWYHILIEKVGSDTINFYVDNVLIGSKTFGAEIWLHSLKTIDQGEIFIGYGTYFTAANHGTYGVGYNSAYVDELGFWNRTLNERERAELIALTGPII